MEPKIAVVMPIYKAENFLRRSLDSVLNQDFKDIKLICVNDASPDNCSKILEEYAAKDDRIVIINHEVNKGASAARNTGLDYVYSNLPSVEYISLVDADDRIELNTYSKAYEEAIKSDADILNFNFLPSTYWDYKTEANTEPVEYNGNCVQALFDYKEFYTFIVCWSKLYKKSLLENIRFSNYRFFEDGCFAYKVLTRAKKLRVIPDTFYCYNIENSDSTCSKLDEYNRLDAILAIMKETVEDWKQLGVYDKYKYDFIKHILLYISLVCPNASIGDYTSQLNDGLDVDILSDEVMNNVPEDTQALIKKMTTNPNKIELSENYKNNIISMFNDVGRNWLDRIPGIVEKYINEFQLTDIKVNDELTYNVVMSAKSATYGDVILKIEIPFEEMTIREAGALEINDGKGACKCFYKNISDGVVLLEKLSPGYSLNEEKSLEARIKVFADVAKKFNVKVSGETNLPTYMSIFERSIDIVFKDEKYKEIRDLVSVADELYKDIEEKDDNNYLLHSDLYSDNIIMSQEGYKAIDPHGFIGNRIIDTAIIIQKELDKIGYGKENLDMILDLMTKYTDDDKLDVAKAFYVNYVLNICWDREVNIINDQCLVNAEMILDYVKKYSRNNIKKLGSKE